MALVLKTSVGASSPSVRIRPSPFQKPRQTRGFSMPYLAAFYYPRKDVRTKVSVLVGESFELLQKSLVESIITASNQFWINRFLQIRSKGIRADLQSCLSPLLQWSRVRASFQVLPWTHQKARRRINSSQRCKSQSN